MQEIKPCDICGRVPSLVRSHSSGMISHQCKDYHSGWASPQKAISNWNNSNSQKKKEAVQTSHNSDYIKCSDEVLKVINYSRGSVHGRKIIDIIKRHFT